MGESLATYPIGPPDPKGVAKLPGVGDGPASAMAAPVCSARRFAQLGEAPWIRPSRGL